MTNIYHFVNYKRYIKEILDVLSVIMEYEIFLGIKLNWD